MNDNKKTIDDDTKKADKLESEAHNDEKTDDDKNTDDRQQTIDDDTKKADKLESEAHNDEKTGHIDNETEILRRENLALKSEKLLSKISWLNDDEVDLFKENFGNLDIETQTKFVEFLQNFQDDRNKKQKKEENISGSNQNDRFYL